MRYSAVCERALIAAGWSLERNVCIDDWLNRLFSEGYRPIPTAVQLLANLGTLTIHLPNQLPKNPYAHDLIIDPMQCGSGERDRVEEWEALLGTDLFPLGYVTPVDTGLWIGSNGLIYNGFEFGLYLIGNSFDQALERLLTSDFDNWALVVA